MWKEQVRNPSATGRSIRKAEGPLTCAGHWLGKFRCRYGATRQPLVFNVSQIVPPAFSRANRLPCPCRWAAIAQGLYMVLFARLHATSLFRTSDLAKNIYQTDIRASAVLSLEIFGVLNARKQLRRSCQTTPWTLRSVTGDVQFNLCYLILQCIDILQPRPTSGINSALATASLTDAHNSSTDWRCASHCLRKNGRYCYCCHSN
jgi:hypothetical protein